MVGANADAAPQVIEIIRSLGLPLGISFNLSRLMVLPHGVSKASGLGGALAPACLGAQRGRRRKRRKRSRLIEACEIGAAVAWGSEALRRWADEIVPGNGPARLPDTFATFFRSRGSRRSGWDAVGYASGP